MQLISLKNISKRFCTALFIISSAVLISTILFTRYFNSVSLTLFPSPDILIDPVSDTWEGGNSWVGYEYHDSVLTYSYRLKPGFNYPYAGVKLHLAQPKSTGLDLSQFDSIHIDIAVSNSDAVRIFIKSYDPRITDTLKPNTYMYHEKEFIATGTASFSLRDFTIPVWWKLQHPHAKQDGLSGFRRVNHIELLNGLSITTQDSVTAALRSISISGKNRFLANGLYTLAALMWTCTLCVIIAYIIKTREKQKIDVFRSGALSDYKKIQQKSEEEEKRDRLISYMAENYFDPDLTIELLATKTGISRKTASWLIKKYLHANFKGYLNSLRLNEASRLLKESDRQITEIALSVGYNNISHFSRIFKERFTVSPKDYRGKR